VLPRRDVPVVAARAAFLGGLLAEDESTSGLTAFLTSMWLRGTRSHSAAGFAAAVEGLAAEIDAYSGRSSFGLTLEAPSASLDPALDLFTEVLVEPAFDGEEIEREREETLAAIARRGDRLAQQTFLLFAQQQFRHHPYRMPTLGSAAVIGGLDRSPATWCWRWPVTSSRTASRVGSRRASPSWTRAISSLPPLRSRMRRTRSATPSCTRIAPRPIW
jgi:zinc protease